VIHATVNEQPVVELSPSSPASKAIMEVFMRVEELLK